jgi:hypothetical protein
MAARSLPAGIVPQRMPMDASGSAVLDGLDYIEPFESGMAEIEGLVIASIAVRLTKGVGPCPGFEVVPGAPDGVRGEERMILLRLPAEQMKLDEARDLVEVAIAAEPDILERLFLAWEHLKAIHRDEHMRPPRPVLSGKNR